MPRTGLKNCSQCGTSISIHSHICPHCGRPADAASPSSVAAENDTKPCPFCAETIKAAAKVCRFCNRDLTQTQMKSFALAPVATPGSGKDAGTEVVKALASIALTFGIGWWLFGGMITSAISGDNASAPAAAPPPSAVETVAVSTPPTSSGPKLKVIKWTWSRESDFCIAEGQVKNISGEPLKNVEAVVTFYDKKDGFITSDDSLIDYNPILPGQISPFKVMKSDNPAIRRAKIEFKDFGGGAIETTGNL